jgi:Protein of unknown function (DUF4240)
MRWSIGTAAFPLVAAVVALAVVAGCGGAPATQRATVTVTVRTPLPAGPDGTGVAAPVPKVSTTDASAAERAVASTQPAPGADRRAEKRAPARADETEFWRLIAQTRSAAGNDTGRQSELLKDRLTELSPQAIIEFAQIRHRLDQRAYTWRLWGAATVIEDGCSEDCFRDFRGYLISLGRGPYEAALRDPDSLASVAEGAEAGDWENADNVAPDAYSSVTGNDFPLDDSDLSGRPRGTPFGDNDEAGLARRYPRLAARFR